MKPQLKLVKPLWNLYKNYINLVFSWIRQSEIHYLHLSYLYYHVWSVNSMYDLS